MTKNYNHFTLLNTKSYNGIHKTKDLRIEEKAKSLLN